MNFATPKFNAAVKAFQNNFGGHKQLYTYGQFYVTNLTVRLIFDTIVTSLEANPLFNKPFIIHVPGAGGGEDVPAEKYRENVVKFFRQKVWETRPDEINGPVILAAMDLVEQLSGAKLTDLRDFFTQGDKAKETRDVQAQFNAVWGSTDVPTAPAWVPNPTVSRAIAAYNLEKDRCFLVTQSMARKLTELRGTAPLTAAAVLNEPQLAQAQPPREIVAAAPPNDDGQQAIVHLNPGALPAAYAKMRQAIDEHGFVMCGVLSGTRGGFPNPEHYVLVFDHDVLDGQDAFLFWDPDAVRSNIASTAPAAGPDGWGPGFAVLFATAKRLSTAIDDNDLKAIRRDRTDRLFGDHTNENRRHCYQVYYLVSLPMRSKVIVHTKALASPKRASLDTMLFNATTLFASHGIEIVEASREDVTAPGEADLDRFRTLYVGTGDEPTAEVTDLHETMRCNDRGAGVQPSSTDIVVAVVDDLVPAGLGSPNSPPEKPGAVIAASAATEWTLAHELGHVLGLDDVVDTASLMCASTGAITADPPELADADIATIQSSPLAQGT